MNYVTGFECTVCRKEFDNNANILVCPHCGDKGILDVKYDYKEIGKVATKDYFSLNTDYSMWRYSPVMPVEGTEFGRLLRVGWTPLYRSNRLAEIIGLKRLYIKDDGLNPTLSLKDRASAVAVVKAVEDGRDTIACSSTGNAASSLAGNAARLGLKTVIFVPERAPQSKVTQLMIYGAKVIPVKGDYDQTFRLSSQAIDFWGWYNRNAGINPYLVEGKKTVAMEIAEQLSWEVPDWVAVSVGDGCTIAGVYKGFHDLKELGLIERIPKLLGVQAEGCCPFYTSFRNNTPLARAEENTIADSIAVGVPRNPVKAVNAVKNSGGSWTAVSDREILNTMQMLGVNEGLFGEPAGVTGMAGVIKVLSEGLIKSDESVAVIISGNGLKDIKSAVSAVGSPMVCEPDMEHLKELMPK